MTCGRESREARLLRLGVAWSCLVVGAEHILLAVVLPSPWGQLALPLGAALTTGSMAAFMGGPR